MKAMIQRAFDPAATADDGAAKCYGSPMSSPDEKQKLIDVLCELPDDSANEDVLALVQQMSGGALSPRGEVVYCLLISPPEERRRVAELIAAGINPSDRELFGPYLFEEDDKELAIQEEIEAAWGVELKRRIEELDNGTVRAIPWEEYQASMDEYLDSIDAK